MAFDMQEELMVAVKDEPGTLAALLDTLSDAKIDVRAFCAYAMPGGANVHIVASDPKRARAVLKKAGYAKVAAHDVVVGKVKDKRGAGAAIAARAAKKKINLEYAYATGTGKGMGLVVLAAGKSTAKLAKALR
jgi:hypothetical protein